MCRSVSTARCLGEVENHRQIRLFSVAATHLPRDRPSTDSRDSVQSRSLSQVLLDKFCGDDGKDLDSWLFHVRSVADLERWNSALQLHYATVAPAGRARAKYRLFMSTINDPVPWEVFEQFLQDQFVPKKTVRHYTRKQMSIKQGSHETVSTYCSRFRRTLLQLQSAQDSVLPDLTVVTWFQEGLRPEFQVELERDQR